jgi:hypothetical protein
MAEKAIIVETNTRDASTYVVEIMMSAADYEPPTLVYIDLIMFRHPYTPERTDTKIAATCIPPLRLTDERQFTADRCSAVQ